MFCRIIGTAGCLLLLAACQEVGRPSHSSMAVTSPSSFSLKAVDVPFSVGVTGEAAFDFVNNSKGCASGFTTKTTATGTATHMGRVTWESRHCVGEQSTLEEAELVLTGANGDKLYLSYDGTCALEGINVVCAGSYDVTGGTGRFSDATGTGDFKATIVFEGFDDYSWPGRWEFKGMIRY